MDLGHDIFPFLFLFLVKELLNEGTPTELISAERAEDLRQKEKRRKVREVSCLLLLKFLHLCLIGCAPIVLKSLYIILWAICLWQKNLPRKKRRRLEAQREMMENDREEDDNEVLIL